MNKKQPRLVAKIALVAALAFSFTLVQAPNAYGFGTDDQNPPTQDSSKDKSKQGPDKKDAPKQTTQDSSSNALLLLLSWLLS